MHDATLIYPHQLFLQHPALKKERPVYLIEEPLLLTHNPIHRQKLLFHFDTLDCFETHLRNKGYTVERLSILKHPTTKSVFAALKAKGIETIHVVDTTDNYLEQALTHSGLRREWYESPLFLLPRNEAKERFITSKKFMASFYKKLRQDRHILLEADGSPVGGAWSFDTENRKRVPKQATLPEDIRVEAVDEATKKLLEAIPAQQYGTPGRWLPTTHAAAKIFLDEFLVLRFAQFGDFEDAIHTSHTRLWHSTLSPLINVGLLTPQQVLDAALTYASTHSIPINSLEGFVRQILGWREFIRASYEVDGSTMRRKNFFSHNAPLPEQFWHGTTGLLPFDHTIKTVLDTGYTHHIERLMVMGSGLLMLGIRPDDVYAWFMGMYLDAYDWVMVPNVYGMSQFADGGSFATKPYLSGANYLKKMSTYESGDWEDTWTALYWNFIHRHREVFAKNYRMSMMPRLLERMDKATLDSHLRRAAAYQKSLFL